MYACAKHGHKVDPPQAYRGKGANIANNLGETALYFAVYFKRRDTLYTLLDPVLWLRFIDQLCLNCDKSSSMCVVPTS